jgi:hypothetical protein
MFEAVVEPIGEQFLERAAIVGLLVVVIANDFIDWHRQLLESIADWGEFLGLASLGKVADKKHELRPLGVGLHLLDQGLQPGFPLLVEMVEVIHHEEAEVG